MRAASVFSWGRSSCWRPRGSWQTGWSTRTGLTSWLKKQCFRHDDYRCVILGDVEQNCSQPSVQLSFGILQQLFSFRHTMPRKRAASWVGEFQLDPWSIAHHADIFFFITTRTTRKEWPRIARWLSEADARRCGESLDSLVDPNPPLRDTRREKSFRIPKPFYNKEGLAPGNGRGESVLCFYRESWKTEGEE